MKISVVGVGGMGKSLALRLGQLGHEVNLASARGPVALSGLSAELGATPIEVEEAAAAELVLLAIPTKSMPALPRKLFAHASRDLVVVDLANYHPELRDGRIEAIEDGLLESEWVVRQLGRPVIKAFNTIFARSLLEKGASKGTPARVALPVAGDSVAGKALVLRLVEALGFDAIDAGRLADSWRLSTGTPAYCKDLTAPELERALAAAERTQVAEYRRAEEARIRRSLG